MVVYVQWLYNFHLFGTILKFLIQMLIVDTMESKNNSKRGPKKDILSYFSSG